MTDKLISSSTYFRTLAIFSSLAFKILYKVIKKKIDIGKMYYKILSKNKFIFMQPPQKEKFTNNFGKLLFFGTLSYEPNKVALDAVARETSLSEIPPTPPDKK